MCRESFFANCRVRGGYSGVATFCRAATCVPVAALDGFTGACMLHPSDQLTRPMHCLVGISDACTLLCFRVRERLTCPTHCLASMQSEQPLAEPVCWASRPQRGAVLRQQALRLSGETALCRASVTEPGKAEGSASAHPRAGGAFQPMLRAV